MLVQAHVAPLGTQQVERDIALGEATTERKIQPTEQVEKRRSVRTPCASCKATTTSPLEATASMPGVRVQDPWP